MMKNNYHWILLLDKYIIYLLGDKYTIGIAAGIINFLYDR